MSSSRHAKPRRTEIIGVPGAWPGGTRFAPETGVGTSELLGVTNQQALQFFYERLVDVTDDSDPPRDELLYNASVLAHFATTSIASETFPACPASLSTVFDLYVLDREALAHDPGIVEAAASQCLLLTGFFQEQQRARHQIGWYTDLGSSFFARAARLSADARRGRLMAVMARRFTFWREQQRQLAVELRESPLLIASLRTPKPH
jgi:hypothetical protein